MAPSFGGDNAPRATRGGVSGLYLGTSMDLVKLRSLIQVAEAGSLTKAAAGLKVSQPALSRHISILERELGTELFRRDGGGMKITRGGQHALRYARRIVRDFELMKVDVRLGGHGSSDQ